MGKTKNHDVKSSVYRGVSLLKVTGKWVAQYKHKGHTEYLGCFSTELEAAYAYDDGKRDAMANGKIPNKILKLNFPNRKNGHAHSKDLRHFRASYKNKKSLIEPNPFRCKGVTYYQARDIWKVSYCYKKTKTYVGAYSSQENAIKSGVEYLKLNRNKFSDSWIDKTIKEHEEVLQLHEMLYDTDLFSLPPLLFSSDRSPSPELSMEDLLREESPSLDSGKIFVPSVS